MKRINQFQFYQLGMNLHPLARVVTGTLLQNVAWDIFSAKSWLFSLLNGQFGFFLHVSKKPAETLLMALNSVLPDVPPGSPAPFGAIQPGTKIESWQSSWITSCLREFETVFSAELPTIATYIVSKKGIYDTADLTEHADQAIDATVRGVISEDAKTDFLQAGKCLAFELPTASGFHTMRAVEAILRQYWTLVIKPAAGTKLPEMAQCINDLRAKGEDPKLMDILDHVRDLHRNPQMHPEAFLTTGEALRLFDIAKSAISAMGDKIIGHEKAQAALAPTPTHGVAP